ncbi:hypothetical protein [Streptomyces sp. RFCAC02]|uniref:hypothetical protein n=1 Tax=Streptomyces sp. RFCAC02 TaxID=2499143 RepID=UPI001020AFC9|nr:hypothetical protein [Streptomyces sp. RFCAC02]
MISSVTRHLARGLAVAALAAGAVVAVPAGAQAAACPTQAPPANLNPWSGTDRAVDETPVRKGPSAQCLQVGTYYEGDDVTVNCYVVNAAGRSWSYIRGYGWVRDTHLLDHGATHECVM